MDMVFQGFLINLFQASQLSVTVSSCDLKILFDNELSRMNRQMLSTGLSSGERGSTTGNVHHWACLANRAPYDRSGRPVRRP
jgi:hypothetical protein